MSRFKRSQAKYVKQTHTITNWPAYDQALVTRGSLTFWFTDEAIRKWTAPPSGNAGGQRKYSNLAIETALAFRMVFHLPWRQTKGCLQSLVEIHGLTLEIPYHTTFSRRAKGLGKVAFHMPRQDRPHKALRLAQGQTEDEPERQGGLDREIREPLLPTGLTGWRRSLPRQGRRQFASHRSVLLGQMRATDLADDRDDFIESRLDDLRDGVVAWHGHRRCLGAWLRVPGSGSH